MSINSVTTSQALLYFRSGGVARWSTYRDNGAESGGDAGSDFRIAAYNDAGAFIDNPISIIRAAGGAITLARPTNASYQLKQFSTEAVTSGNWSQVATNTSVNSTTKISLWGGARTIAANRITTAGQKIRVRATGRLSGLNATGFTATVDIGGVSVGTVSDTLPSALSSQAFRIEGDLKFRTVGASGTV
jgi:hypothetical protein